VNVKNNKDTNYKDTRWSDKMREKIRANSKRTAVRTKISGVPGQEKESADGHKIDQRVVR